MAHIIVGSSSPSDETLEPQNNRQPHTLPERLSDIALARAAAQAARATPGVVDLSAGRVAPAATYGAGERVIGVIIHHPTPDTCAIEVHVVLSESLWASAAPHDATVAPQESVQESVAEYPAQLSRIPEIAERIRDEVWRAIQMTAAPSVSAIDVFIDDLQ